MIGILNDPQESRDRIDLGGIGELLRFDFVTHGIDRLGLWADEHNAIAFQRFAEGGALGEKSVAGMHCFGAGRLAGFQNLLGNEIARRCRGRPDMNGLIGHFDVNGVAVRIRIDRNCQDSHSPGGLDHAAGYLAAIGDQDLLEHAAFPSVFLFSYGVQRRGSRRGYAKALRDTCITFPVRLQVVPALEL